MSKENVELAKRFNEAGRHGDVEAAFFHACNREPGSRSRRAT